MKTRTTRLLTSSLLLLTSSLSAAALYSIELGNFFSLPEWLPIHESPCAPSYWTPGSDPEDFSGWYSPDEYYTNSTPVYGNWVVKCRAKNSYYGDYAEYAISGEPSWSNGDWNIENIPNPSFVKAYLVRNEDSHYHKTQWGDRTATNLEWTVQSHLYKIPEDDSSTWGNSLGFPFYYRASRSMEQHPIPVTNGLPHAARLTPHMQLAINSTFEAFYERVYNASLGESNVWDVAVYGPKTKRGFVFAWEHQTNRVIRSRRLDEYVNLKSLRGTLLDIFHNHFCDVRYPNVSSGDAGIAFAKRPGWMAGQNGSYRVKPSMWWTTTSDKWGSFVLFPTLLWGPLPSYVLNFSMPVFGSLRPDGCWDSESEWEYASPQSVLIYKHFVSGWGFPDLADSFQQIPNSISNMTMKCLIEKNFPHGSGSDVTNHTRRLDSCWISCMNKVLGLMDRTIQNPYIDLSTTYTNTVYHNKISASGSVVVKCHLDDSLNVITDSVKSASWESPATTNWTEVSGGRTDFPILHVSADNSGGACGGGGSTPIFYRSVSSREYVSSVEGFGILDEMTPEDFGMDEDGHLVISVTTNGFYIYMGKVYSRYVVLNDKDEEFRSDHIYLGDLSSTNSVAVTNSMTAVFTRNYSYMRPVYIGEPTFGPLNGCGNQVAAKEVSFLSSIVTATDWQHTYPISYISSNYNRSQIFNSNNYAYANNESLRSLARSEYQNLESKMFSLASAQYGTNPNDFTRMIPVTGSLGNIIPNGRYRVSGRLDGPYVNGFREAYIVLIYEDEQWKYDHTDLYYGEYDFREINDTDETFATVSCSIYTDLETQESFIYESIEPYHEDGRLSALTMIDWEWKALKRDDEDD